MENPFFFLLLITPPFVAMLAGFSILLGKIRAVHEIVNHQRDVMQDEIAELKKVIATHAAAQVLEEARAVLRREAALVKETSPEGEGT